MRITRLIPLATGVFLFVAASMTVHAASPVILITEKSSTQLTATVAGTNFGSITLNAPDNWNFVYPSGLTLATEADPLTYWLEPESTASKVLGNWFFNTGQQSTTIESDFNFTGFANPSIPNNSISMDKLTFQTASGATETFSVQYNDLGDAAGVPDSSSTAGMLLLSLAVIFGAARMRTVRAF